MAKRSPGNQTRNIKPHQTVKNYHGSTSLFSIRCFDFGTFTSRQFPLEKLVYLQKTGTNPNNQNVQRDFFSGEIVPVCHWSKNTIPSVNSQAHDIQNGDSHCEERVSAREDTAEEFASYTTRNWKWGDADDVAGCKRKENPWRWKTTTIICLYLLMPGTIISQSVTQMTNAFKYLCVNYVKSKGNTSYLLKLPNWIAKRNNIKFKH